MYCGLIKEENLETITISIKLRADSTREILIVCGKDFAGPRVGKAIFVGEDVVNKHIISEKET